MSSLYDVMEQMKTIFVSGGYTVYDITEFSDTKVSQLPFNEFPVIFLGRQTENIGNEGSPLHFLENSADIDVNVVLNTGEQNLYQDASNELRKLKNLIYTNRCSGDYWVDWVMTDNFITQLQSSNQNSKVFGGININTNVAYREQQITEN